MRFPTFGKKKSGRKKKGGTPGRKRVPLLETPKGPQRRYPTLKSKKAKSFPQIRKLLKKMKRGLRRFIFPCVAAALVFGLWFALSLPSIDKLNEAGKNPSVVIKSEDGRIVGSYGDIYGDYLKYDEFPDSLVDSVMATEDRNFFYHFGVDPMGLARAIVANFRAKGLVQGGSTITQQVAKNLFLTPERTLIRKLREVFLALKLEARYSKKEIMAIYLNRVYLGAGTFGVDAAAKRYFNKSARELSLSESAILAGLLKAPSRFAPTANPELAKKRAEQVLLNMVDAKYLKEAQAEKAKKELAVTITRTAKNTSESSLYFSDWIVEQLPDYIGTVSEDIVVTATLNPQMQSMAQNAITTIMDKEAEPRKASQAALVAMAPDGAVRALIGGRDYSKSQYNRATQAHRQPGSAFKLFVYLTGLEGGLTPNTVVLDEPISVGNWQPHNYDGKYRGEISIREAVAESVNTVAVQVSERFGRSRVVAMARRLGIQSDLNPDPSIALGSNEVTLLELTTAYAHLAANGEMVEPYGILRIETTAGQPLYVRQPGGGGQVLATSVVGMMNSLLEGVITSGTGRGASIGRSSAGKTGTTSDYRDAWFVGYTPDLVAGVWVGNDDNSEMKKVTGGTLPAPIWREFMRPALAGTAARELPTSSGFWNSILPWQGPDDAQTAPQQPAQAPVEQRGMYQPWRDPNPPPAAQPAPPRRDGDFNLSPQFWNKLMGSGKVEHTYPDQRDR